MLYLDNIWKAYGTGKNRTAVLRDITLCFRETGLVFVAGAAGSAKSTLLDIMAGLRYPTCGCVYKDGRRITGYGAFRMDRYRHTYCGYLATDFRAIAGCSIGEAVDGCLPHPAGQEGQPRRRGGRTRQSRPCG